MEPRVGEDPSKAHSDSIRMKYTIHALERALSRVRGDTSRREDIQKLRSLRKATIDKMKAASRRPPPQALNWAEAKRAQAARDRYQSSDRNELLRELLGLYGCASETIRLAGVDEIWWGDGGTGGADGSANALWAPLGPGEHHVLQNVSDGGPWFDDIYPGDQTFDPTWRSDTCRLTFEMPRDVGRCKYRHIDWRVRVSVNAEFRTWEAPVGPTAVHAWVSYGTRLAVSDPAPHPHALPLSLLLSLNEDLKSSSRELIISGQVLNAPEMVLLDIGFSLDTIITNGSAETQATFKVDSSEFDAPGASIVLSRGTG